MFDMPRDLKLKVGKRITFFMEHLLKKRQKSRVNVYVEHLRKISNKEIYEIGDRDVLHFWFLKMLMIREEQWCIKKLVPIWVLLHSNLVQIKFSVD